MTGSRGVRRSHRAALAVLAWLAPAAPCAAASLDAYAPSVSGSARQVGLAGANLADPSDYSSVFVNPAGLAGLSGKGLDFGADSDSVENFVVDLEDPKSRVLNDPLRHNYVGVRYVTESGWGLGLAAQRPFDETDSFDVQTRRKIGGRTVTVRTGDAAVLKTAVNTYSLAAAKTFLDGRLAVGLALNYNRVDQDFAFEPEVSSMAYANSATHGSFTGDVGLLAAPRNWLKLALVYKMGTRVGFGESLRPQLSAFPDVKTPDRLSFGFSLQPHRMVRLYGKSTYVFAMSDTMVMGSGLFPRAPHAVVATGRYDTVSGHAGLEFVPLDAPDLTIRFWGGGYYEETGVQGGYDRIHRTAGFSFEPWFLSVAFAIDDAEHYNNFCAGVGVDVFQAARRVARSMGKELPL